MGTDDSHQVERISWKLVPASISSSVLSLVRLTDILYHLVCSVIMMLVSLLIVVGSLSIVRSQGGIQSGLCSGRDSACTELEEGETCYTTQHQADWITTCNEVC